MKTTESLYWPPPKSIARLDGSYIYLQRPSVDRYFLIVDTGGFEGRRLITEREEVSYSGLTLDQPPELGITGSILERPIIVRANEDVEVLLSLAQALVKADINSVDLVFNVLNGLLDTLSPPTEEEEEIDVGVSEMYGVVGELFVIRDAVRDAGKTACDAILAAHHKGEGHVYDFTAQVGGRACDVKAFGTSNPYRVYMTPEELHDQEGADLLLVGVRKLSCDDPGGQTLQEIFDELQENPNLDAGLLEPWLEPYLNSQLGLNSSFAPLQAHPSKGINIEDIPTIDALRGLELPFNNVREVPTHLSGAQALTEENYENAIETFRTVG